MESNKVENPGSQPEATPNEETLKQKSASNYPCGGVCVALNGSCKKKHRCANADKCSATYPDETKKLSKKEKLEVKEKMTEEKTTVPASKGKAPKKIKARAADNVGKTPAPEETKAPAAPAPKTPKVAGFPISAEINKYGFLGLGKDELRALGLEVVTTEGAKEKLAADVKVSITTFNAETKELTVKLV